MREYRTTNIVDLYTGKIGLSEKQAARRPGKLKKVKAGIYEILAPVQFKAGEKIKLNKPDKVTFAKLEDLTPEPVKKSKRAAKK